MGLISGLRALHSMKKIRKGKSAKLSIEQITSLNVNLQDANRFLSKQEFNQVFALYSKLLKNKTKTLYNIRTYSDAVYDIAEEFDKIAPYNLYNGYSIKNN